MKADTGSDIVIMNRDDYISELTDNLKTTFTIKKLDENPQERFY
jgi:hypothetical protein